MTRRPGTLGTHRLILGALALVLIIVSIYVAFASTRGVPLAPKYDLTVQVPNAAQLTGGADVTVAGTRVGQVTDVRPAIDENGQPVAEADLALDNGFGPLPEDSTFSVHLSGSLGRKTVQISPGSSNRTLSDDDFVPVSGETEDVVDVDQVLNAFDEGARQGTRDSLEALGVGFAGRGADLNAAVQNLPDTLSEVTGSMRILGAPSTDLGRFTAGLTAFGAELGPTAPLLPGLVTDLNSTFQAFNSSREPLQESISETPELLDTVTRTLPRERRVIRATSLLMHELEPGTSTLPETAPAVADALEAGVANLPLVPRLSERAATALRDIANYGEAPPVVPGLTRLAETTNALQPLVAFLTPAETQCSYFSLLFRNLSSLLKETFATGSAVRAGGVVTDVARNSERGPSAGISTAKPAKSLGPVHSNPYPNTAAPGQPRECEAGNEPYITNGPVIGNVPGTQKATTENPVTSP